MASETKDGWTVAGVIGVDAGIVLIGDPCYAETEQRHPANRDWQDFCDAYDAAPDGIMQLNYDMGHPGLGVVVPSGYGDGTYEVEVRRTSDGRVAELRVVFIEEQENEAGDAV